MADLTISTRPESINRPFVPGAKFGRLTALREVDGQRWLFRCDCGTQKVVYRRTVARGDTRSCGCYHRELMARVKATHGHSRGYKRSPEMQAHHRMMARCYRPSNNRYHRYGARGIKVCERWHTFENFLADMGLRPSPQHSVDRIDNDGDYEPSNCRWATRKEQGRNRSNNVLLTVRGETMTCIEASERFGIPYATLKARIQNYGWSDEEAVSIPPRGKRK